MVLRLKQIVCFTLCFNLGHRQKLLQVLNALNQILLSKNYLKKKGDQTFAWSPFFGERIC